MKQVLGGGLHLRRILLSLVWRASPPVLESQQFDSLSEAQDVWTKRWIWRPFLGTQSACAPEQPCLCGQGLRANPETSDGHWALSSRVFGKLDLP